MKRHPSSSVECLPSIQFYPLKGNQCLRMHSYKGPFIDALTALRGDKVELVSLEDLAEIKMICFRNRGLIHHKWWVGECYVYLPNGETLVTSRENNPILVRMNPALKAHQRGQEFFLDDIVSDDLRERAETDPEKAFKTGVLLLDKDRKAVFPCTALADEPETYFLFRKWAKQYGEFLEENRAEYFSPYDINRKLSITLKIRRDDYSTDTILFPEFNIILKERTNKITHARPFAQALVDGMYSHFQESKPLTYSGDGIPLIVSGIERTREKPAVYKDPQRTYIVTMYGPFCECKIDMKMLAKMNAKRHKK